VRICCIVGILSCMIAAPAAGQPCFGLRTVGNTIDVTPDADRYRGHPSVAFGSTAQQYMVVWFENRSELTGNDIARRIVAADGTLVGNVEPVIEKPDSQSGPTIAWSSTDNRFVVAWLTQESGFFSHVFARVLLADGTPLAPDFGVSNGGLEIAIDFGVSNTPNVPSRYLLTGRGGGITGQFLSSGGSLSGQNFGLHQSGSAAPNGDVAFDPLNQRFLAVWRDQGNQAQNIQARLARLDGTFATNPFVAVDEFPFDMRVAFDPELRRFLIVFNDAGNTSLRARFIDENGGLQGDPFTILDTKVAAFDVVYNPAGHAFVLSCNVTQPIGGQALVGVAVGGDGTVGRDRVMLATGGQYQRPSSLALNPQTGECLVVWSEARVNDANFEWIRARRLVFGEPACSAIPGCGVGVCGGGFAPMMPLTLAAMAWMKRRRRELRHRATR